MNVWEIHPALVHFPLAFLVAGVVLDFYAAWRRRAGYTRVAAGLLMWGMATGWITAVAGIAAWLTAPHSSESHALMYWHPALAAASMISFTILAIVRWKRRALFATPSTEGLGAIACLLILTAAWLGGTLVYRDGAGVDAARDARPAEFHTEMQRDDETKPAY